MRKLMRWEKMRGDEVLLGDARTSEVSWWTVRPYAFLPVPPIVLSGVDLLKMRSDAERNRARRTPEYWEARRAACEAA